MFKHKIRYNWIFAINIIWPFLFLKDFNFILYYISYFVFFGLGIGIGYHRVLCHGIKINPLIEKIFILIGSFTHVGSIVGSAVWHTQHHLYADSEHDIYKSFRFALTPKLDKFKISKNILRSKINPIRKVWFYKIIDQYFYIFLSLFYFSVLFIFGLRTTLVYFLSPAALALVVHSYGSIVVHRYGYKNYHLTDKSHNLLWAFPLMFGENWHNNHHYSPNIANLGKRWWELDLLYIIMIPLGLRKKSLH